MSNTHASPGHTRRHARVPSRSFTSLYEFDRYLKARDDLKDVEEFQLTIPPPASYPDLIVIRKQITAILKKKSAVDNRLQNKRSEIEAHLAQDKAANKPIQNVWMAVVAIEFGGPDLQDEAEKFASRLGYDVGISSKLDTEESKLPEPFKDVAVLRANFLQGFQVGQKLRYKVDDQQAAKHQKKKRWRGEKAGSGFQRMQSNSEYLDALEVCETLQIRWCEREFGDDLVGSVMLSILASPI